MLLSHALKGHLFQSRQHRQAHAIHTGVARKVFLSTEVLSYNFHWFEPSHPTGPILATAAQTTFPSPRPESCPFGVCFGCVVIKRVVLSLTKTVKDL